MENYSQLLAMKKDLKKVVAAWRKRTAPQKSTYAREYPKCSMSCAQMEKRTATINFWHYPDSMEDFKRFALSSAFADFRDRNGILSYFRESNSGGDVILRINY